MLFCFCNESFAKRNGQQLINFCGVFIRTSFYSNAYLHSWWNDEIVIIYSWKIVYTCVKHLHKRFTQRHKCNRGKTPVQLFIKFINWKLYWLFAHMELIPSAKYLVRMVLHLLDLNSLSCKCLYDHVVLYEVCCRKQLLLFLHCMVSSLHQSVSYLCSYESLAPGKTWCFVKSPDADNLYIGVKQW